MAETTEKFDMNAERERILAAATEAIKAAIPADMLPEKVTDRSAMIAMYFGTTRTTVVAALVYASFYAQIVGLDLEKQHELLNSINSILKDSPYTAEAKESYERQNKQYHEKLAEKQLGTLDGEIVLPGDGKVH